MSSLPEPRTILIYPPNPLGDFVMAIPAVRTLRKRFPDAKVTLLLKPPYRPLIEGCEWYDEAIPNPAGRGEGGWQKALGTVRALRRQRFDLAVIFANSFRSALICRLASAGRRIGYNRQQRGWLLTDRIKPPCDGSRVLPMPMVDYYLGLVASLGCDTSDRSISLPVPEHSLAQARSLLKRHGADPDCITLGIAPGARYGPSKLWIDRYYGEVIDHFVTRHNAHVLLLTGPGEEDIARAVEAAAKHRLIPVSGRVFPLDMLKALIKLCTIFLTTDSGPRHIATAVGTPHVALLGPTDPVFSQTDTPYGVVLTAEAECAPCQLRECPTDHRCMTRLSSERVIAALEALLQERGHP